MQRMALYWGIGSAVSVLAPMTGGWIMSQFGLHTFIAIGLAILVLALILTVWVKRVEYPYTRAEITNHIKNFRVISMLDGALQSTSGLLIALYLLTFIKSEFNFGQVLSMIALVSVVLSLRLARISDRTKKRLEFIWPLSVVIGILMTSLYFVQSLGLAVIIIIAYQFLNNLLNPIRSNILLDNVTNASITWISRELYLNIGRTITLVSLSVIVYTGHLREAFLIMAVLFFVFPIMLLSKQVYGKNKLS